MVEVFHGLVKYLLLNSIDHCLYYFKWCTYYISELNKNLQSVYTFPCYSMAVLLSLANTA
jgi:hypothetical protein